MKLYIKLLFFTWIVGNSLPILSADPIKDVKDGLGGLMAKLYTLKAGLTDLQGKLGELTLAASGGMASSLPKSTNSKFSSLNEADVIKILTDITTLDPARSLMVDGVDIGDAELTTSVKLSEKADLFSQRELGTEEAKALGLFLLKGMNKGAIPLYENYSPSRLKLIAPAKTTLYFIKTNNEIRAAGLVFVRVNDTPIKRGENINPHIALCEEIHQRCLFPGDNSTIIKKNLQAVRAQITAVTDVELPDLTYKLKEIKNDTDFVYEQVADLVEKPLALATWQQWLTDMEGPGAAPTQNRGIHEKINGQIGRAFTVANESTPENNSKTQANLNVILKKIDDLNSKCVKDTDNVNFDHEIKQVKLLINVAELEQRDLARSEGNHQQIIEKFGALQTKVAAYNKMRSDAKAYPLNTEYLKKKQEEAVGRDIWFNDGGAMPLLSFEPYL